MSGLGKGALSRESRPLDGWVSTQDPLPIKGAHGVPADGILPHHLQDLRRGHHGILPDSRIGPTHPNRRQEPSQQKAPSWTSQHRLWPPRSQVHPQVSALQRATVREADHPQACGPCPPRPMPGIEGELDVHKATALLGRPMPLVVRVHSLDWQIARCSSSQHPCGSQNVY